MSVTREVAVGSLGELGSRLPEPGAVAVTIEVVGMELGDQLEAHMAPWHALVYDPTTSIVEISVGGRDDPATVVLRHEIHDPKAVWVEEDAGAVKAISIEDRGETRTIVSFHERPAIAGGG